MTSLLLLVACVGPATDPLASRDTDPTIDGPAPVAPDPDLPGPGERPELPYTPDTDEPAPDPGTPAACAEDIYVAGSGSSADVPVLADPHAEAYGAAATPIQPHLSWTGEPSTGAAVLWRTDAETMATTVEIGTEPGRYDWTVEGRSFVLEGDAEIGRVHEVHVCGLLPGTTWYYRVGGEGAWSDEASFTTAPTPGSTDGFVFGVAGDSRGDPTTWAAVVAGMEAHGAEFRLFTGDAVNRGTEMPEWHDWFDAGGSALARTATIPVHGNHEGMAQQYFAQFALPGNEQWFSFDYGNAHFTIVNDSTETEADWDEQLAWLEADLAASSAPWKFLVHHKPAYSSSEVHAEDAFVRSEIVPVAENGGVDVDLTGHNHHYERSLPLHSGALNAETGVTYVVTAGAGAPLYQNDAHNWYTDVAIVSEHYTIIRIQDDILTLYAYDLAGNILDAWSSQR